jgi:pimeloyl-ACP methyl ester carboxylesterase
LFLLEKKLRPASKVAPHPESIPLFFEKSVQRILNFKGWTPEQIRSITAPSLIILGGHDIVRPEHGVLMYRLLPNARLAILPGTDHMTITKRSEWVPSMVGTFLGTTP